MEDIWQLSERDRQILELLAETFIPPDETNEGLRGMGFSGIIEMRNKYQPSLAVIYSVGLKGVDEISNALFQSPFVNITPAQRDIIIASLISGDPPAGAWTGTESPHIFFENLKMDSCFIYGTSEEVWEQIGFSGPSYNSGGHPDYDQPQD